MTSAWHRSRVNLVLFKQMKKFDPEHIWTSVHMNNNGDAPITRHTLEQFIDTQKTNFKNSSMPRLTLGREHLPRDMHAKSAHISHARDARAQDMPRSAYDR